MVARRFVTDCTTQPLWNTPAGRPPHRCPAPPSPMASSTTTTAPGAPSTRSNAATGAKLWHSAPGDFGGDIFGAPLVFHGRLYASSRGGTVHIYG